MSFAVILGWTAAAFGAAISLPQLIRLLRTRTSAGLSVLMWQLLLTAGIGWTHHGFLTAQANIIVPNAIMAISSVAVLRLIQRDRHIPHARVWVLPLVLAAILIGIDLFIGPLAYGIATSIPQVIGAGAQLVDVIRSIDIRGLSPIYLVLAVVVQLLWGSWSLLVKDSSVTVSASANGTVVALTLIWYVLRRLGWVRAMPTAPSRASGTGTAGASHRH